MDKAANRTTRDAYRIDIPGPVKDTVLHNDGYECLLLSADMQYDASDSSSGSDEESSNVESIIERKTGSLCRSFCRQLNRLLSL